MTPRGDKTVKRSKQEQPIEELVSRFIGNMSVLCVSVDDVPDPGGMLGYIKRNSVALLSGLVDMDTVIDPPSSNWLGRHSDWEKVRSSGLWNNKFVGKSCEP